MQYQTKDILYEEYVVKPKDSLYSIAKEFKTTVADLTDVNMLTTNVLYPNQVLLVPTHNKSQDITLLEYYTKDGDTMERISNRVGVPIQTLGAYNDFGKVVLEENQSKGIPL
jgi:LysM repeat protein